MRKTIQNALELVGNTSLLPLDNYAKNAGITDAAVLAKLEYLNPAGSKTPGKRGELYSARNKTYKMMFTE